MTISKKTNFLPLNRYCPCCLFTCYVFCESGNMYDQRDSRQSVGNLTINCDIQRQDKSSTTTSVVKTFLQCTVNVDTSIDAKFRISHQ